MGGTVDPFNSVARSSVGVNGVGPVQRSGSASRVPIPLSLSPSSWARATSTSSHTLPLYQSMPLSSYTNPATDFSTSSRYLNALGLGGYATGSGLGYYAGAGGMTAGLSSNNHRYSDPLTLRGSHLFYAVSATLTLFLWLVRDASLLSFLLFLLFLNGVLYLILVRGEPCSIALLVESAASVAQKQAALAASQMTMQQQVQQGLNRAPSQQAQASAAASSSSAPHANYASPQQQPRASSMKSPAVSSPSKTVSIDAQKPASQPPAQQRTRDPSPVATVEPIQEEEKSHAAAPSSPSPLSPTIHVDEHLVPSSSSSGAPNIDTNLPQTPLAEPVITPLSQRPVESETAAAMSAIDDSSQAAARLPTASTPVVLAGATSRHGSNDQDMSWTRCLGSHFDVRTGPNYKKYGKKAPSKDTMYECVGVDVFGAPDGKLDHIAQHLQLPWIAKKNKTDANGNGNGAADASDDGFFSTAASPTKPPEDPHAPDVLDPVNTALDPYEVDPRVLEIDESLGVPSLFIINFQIPTYAPSYWSSKEDGEGFSILIYYQITAATRAEIRAAQRGEAPLSPAVQLFKDFVANAHEFDYHSRFKCIPRIANPGEAKVGMAVRQLIKAYNAKPFLTGPHCHQFIRGPGYMEADIDVHRFCLTARKGAYGFLDALSSLVVDIAFLVEGGRDGADDELPERVLGCNHMAHLDPLNAKSLAYYIEIGKQQRKERQLAKQRNANQTNA